MSVDVAALVKALRLARGMTQEQLAEAGGLERVEVVGIETGKNHATTARVRKALARGARVGLEDLFRYLDGEMPLEELLRSEPYTPRPGSAREADPYPNRARAIPILREAQFTPDVIRQIEEHQPREDRTVYGWIKLAEAFAAELTPAHPPTPVEMKKTPPPPSPPKSTRRSGR